MAHNNWEISKKWWERQLSQTPKEDGCPVPSEEVIPTLVFLLDKVSGELGSFTLVQDCALAAVAVEVPAHLGHLEWLWPFSALGLTVRQGEDEIRCCRGGTLGLNR